MKGLLISILFLTVFVVELFLGALVALCFQNLISTNWMLPVQGTLKKLLRLIYIIPLLLFLLFLGRQYIYSWTDLNTLKAGFPQTYFSPPFFILRNLIYGAIWMPLALRILNGKQRGGGFPLVLILLTGTFWSIDWLMSLDPLFKSTVFGLVFLISSTLAAYGLVIFLIKSPPPPQILQDINNVHFTLIGTWLYLMFVQYQIIWSGNLPDEAKWFVQGNLHSWRTVVVTLVGLQCLLPLFLLLVRKWKASLKFTRSIGALTFVMQLIHALWVIVPRFL